MNKKKSFKNYPDSIPESRAQRDPPKKPLIGLVAAYTKMDVLKIDPRLKPNKQPIDNSISS